MTASAFGRLLSSLVAAVICACGIGAGAALAADNPTPRMIVVSGEGQVSAAPDQARLSGGVVTQAPTAAAALTSNNAAMAKVIAALHAQGIPDAKIRTSNFSVQPQYPPFRADNPQPRAITGYQVTNQVTVIEDDITKLGALLDALVRSGANEANGVTFGFADPKPLAEKARAAAVADAAAKARTLAAAAGVTLGPILTIQEGGGVRPFGVEEVLVTGSLARDVPVAPGEQTVSVNVTMTYAIQ